MLSTTYRTLCAGLLLALTGPVHAQSSATAPPDRPAHGLIVKLKSGELATTSASAPAAVEREAPQRVRERLARVFRGKSFPLGGVRETGAELQLVHWNRPLTGDEASRLMDELSRDPDVEWVVPNVREKRLQAAPNDARYSEQWWLSAHATDALSRGVPNIATAWSATTGGNVNVAVLDTGLLRNHPDLNDPRFATGYDMVTNDSGLAGDGDGRDADFSDPGDSVTAGQCGAGEPSEDSSWHGSRIAAQIGAITDNGIGVASINRAARVVTVRVAGKCGALVSDILDGMRWAAGLTVSGLPANPHPARIINLSFGGGSTDCRPYQSTIDTLVERGVLVVAAAGNEDRGVARPARCPGVLAVGAVNRDGFKTFYANMGSEVGITTVGGDPADLGALGPVVADGGIWTVTNNGTTSPGSHGYGEAYGTSFSTPIVAGVATLMLAVNPQLTIDQVVHGLQYTSRPHITTSSHSALRLCDASNPRGRCYCTTLTCGSGVLDAQGAVAYAAAPQTYPPAPTFGDRDNGGGGGALGWPWLAALAVAAVLVSRPRRCRACAGH